MDKTPIPAKTAALLFIKEMLERVQILWPQLLDDAGKLRRLGEDESASAQFSFALMAVSCQAIDNLLPEGEALRLRTELEDALRRADPEDETALGAFLKYDHVWRTALFTGRHPLNDVTACFLRSVDAAPLFSFLGEHFVDPFAIDIVSTYLGLEASFWKDFFSNYVISRPVLADKREGCS